MHRRDLAHPTLTALPGLQALFRPPADDLAKKWLGEPERIPSEFRTAYPWSFGKGLIAAVLKSYYTELTF